jgi:hypothetical protein
MFGMFTFVHFCLPVRNPDGPFHPDSDATASKLNVPLIYPRQKGLIPGAVRGNLYPCTEFVIIRQKQKEPEAMKSRAELLAEIEEKRLESNALPSSVDELSIAGPEATDGYNPYDHPGRGKELPDDVDITARRRSLSRR